MLYSLKSKTFINFLINNINSRQSSALLGLWNTAIDDFPAEKKVIAFCTKYDMVADKKGANSPQILHEASVGLYPKFKIR